MQSARDAYMIIARVHAHVQGDFFFLALKNFGLVYTKE